MTGTTVATYLGKATSLLRHTVRYSMGMSVIGTSVHAPLFDATSGRRYSCRAFTKHKIALANESNFLGRNGANKVTSGVTRRTTQTDLECGKVSKKRGRQRRYQIFLAVGSNQGDSFSNIATGIQLLCDPDFSNESYHFTDFVRSSFLYYTKPMYVTNQDSFWNGAVELDTDCDPASLLRRLKVVEEHMGRNLTKIRNGPRPLDLDILLCYDNNNDKEKSEESTPTPVIIETSDLVIPHPRLKEREFVLAPLIDIAGRDLIHPAPENKIPESLGDLLDDLVVSAIGDAGEASATRLMPLPRERFILFDQTIVMGILNITPDSFSDGGKWTDSVDQALARAMEMIDEGATIVDIGGESTRPGAAEISMEEQIGRTVPVIEAIRKRSKEVVLSIDTRHAVVARAAVEAGADIVNDVSGGAHDADMLPTVADMKVPIVLMHMRGNPQSMQDLTDYEDQGGVVDGVVDALLERSRAAEDAGIPRWIQILDPGIGFAKDMEGNLSLLKKYSHLRSKLGDFPLLLGTSRKRFIGELSGEAIAEERDFGTAGSCVAALCLGNDRKDNTLGCNVLRVHNVKGAKQATVVMDAIVKAK